MQGTLAETWAAEKNLCFPEQPDRLQRPSLLQRLQVKPVRTSGRRGYYFTTMLGGRVL